MYVLLELFGQFFCCSSRFGPGSAGFGPKLHAFGVFLHGSLVHYFSVTDLQLLRGILLEFGDILLDS